MVVWHCAARRAGKGQRPVRERSVSNGHIAMCLPAVSQLASVLLVGVVFNS